MERNRGTSVPMYQRKRFFLCLKSFLSQIKKWRHLDSLMKLEEQRKTNESTYDGFPRYSGVAALCRIGALVEFIETKQWKENVEHLKHFQVGGKRKIVLTSSYSSSSTRRCLCSRRVRGRIGVTLKAKKSFLTAHELWRNVAYLGVRARNRSNKAFHHCKFKLTTSRLLNTFSTR